jgi:hypothetical protein
MAPSRYYTPRLKRPLVTALYHAAKARRIRMTQLASLLVRDGLARLAGATAEAAKVCEAPAGDDPPDRTQ